MSSLATSLGKWKCRVTVSAVEVEIEINPEQTVIAGLAELSRKTGLAVRAVGPATVHRLYAEIEKYEEQERAETFSYLKHTLNETRASLGAEAAYKDE